MDLPAMLLVTSSHIQTVYICTDTTIFAAEREPPIDFAWFQCNFGCGYGPKYIKMISSTMDASMENIFTCLFCGLNKVPNDLRHTMGPSPYHHVPRAHVFCWEDPSINSQDFQVQRLVRHHHRCQLMIYKYFKSWPRSTSHRSQAWATRCDSWLSGRKSNS